MHAPCVLNPFTFVYQAGTILGANAALCSGMFSRVEWPADDNDHVPADHNKHPNTNLNRRSQFDSIVI